MWQDQFRQFFRVYPISSMKGPDRSANNYGGKIYLPVSALHKLTTLRISYPMLFELRAEDSKKQTFAGVLEFTAEEGRAYVPEWMLKRLGAKPGSLARISSVTLELGQFIRIQPQSVDFLEISDPKAVLENAMRNFSALTVGDVFQISYNDHVYGIEVLETKPETSTHGICVVETDLEVDFAPPVGYEEPTMGNAGSAINPGGGGRKGAATRAYESIVQSTAEPTGIRLSGKAVPRSVQVVDQAIYSNLNAPPLELPEGQLFFGFPVLPLDVDPEEANDLYKGEGKSLRQSRKRKDPPT